MKRFSFLLFMIAVTPALAEGGLPPIPQRKPPVPVEAPKETPIAVKTDAYGPSRPPASAQKPEQKKPPETKAADAASTEALPPAPDTDETLALPPYPDGAMTSMGKDRTYTIGEEDTLLDVARHFRLGFVEARAANPGVDPWTPVPGKEILIPAFKLLPRAPQEGIVVNLAQMRLYYFRNPKKEPVTFPIGIGREGLQTPTGETTILRKAAGPTWFPTERMRTEKPWMPVSVPAGPSNPLGTHALYLGWPEFLIHGSNKPWAIGRRVSSGCMRMYPEDIATLFKMVPTGTKVTVVDQPLLIGWVGDDLYLESNPSKNQSLDIEINGKHVVKEMTDAIKKVIADAAGAGAERINWQTAKKAYEERRGVPVMITEPKTAAAEKKAETQKPARFDTPKYN